MIRRARRRRLGDSARLEMTSMIDVVFLLLIFFVVTVEPRDVLAKLDVSRPSVPESTRPLLLLRIDVDPDGYVINGRRATLETLRRQLGRIAEISPTTSVIVASTADATHSRLIQLLDTCSAAGLNNVSLMSL